ncbi:MAG: DUF2189 domain-containing protein [Rubrivivax sp.]
MERLPAVAESRIFGTRRVPLSRPLGWLARGALDLRRCPVPGLLHGLATALFGALIVLIAHEHFWLLAGAFSGFLIVAPVLATGLYQISRVLDHRRPPRLADALAVWKPTDGRLMVFGLLLALAGTGWVLTSASLITGFSPEPVRNPQDFLRHVVLAEESRLFELWLALGGVLAAPVFASSVIALPMLLDRQVGILTAVFTSWRVVMDNPAPLALWAALLMGLTVLGMVTGLLGLIPIVPWLAHASWLAYRDLVDPAGLETRPWQ